MGFQKERLIPRTKVQVPEGTLKLQDELAETQYPPTIVCSAGHTLLLQGHRTEWNAGNHAFYLGPIPEYRDDECGITYLPKEVADGAVSCVNKELARLGGRETFQLPQNFRVIE